MNSSIDIITALFGGHARTAVLRLLADQTTPLTGRQVADLAHLSQPGAAKALEHFASLGVVSRRRVGRAITHELLRDNLLVQSIVLPVLEAENSFLDDLLGQLTDTFADTAVSVVLFGSAAHEETHPGSDIDVLLVVRDDESAREANRRADIAGPHFFRRYGMPLSVIVSPVSALAKNQSGFLVRARDEGILVSGRPLSEVMG